jgi:deoxyribodipyrimidine photo-lyase
MSAHKLTIFWARRDFRLQDNPALSHALQFATEHNQEFLPVFILDPGILQHSEFNIGYPRKYALSKILAGFIQNFSEFQVFLGSPEEVFTQLSHNFHLTVFANEDVEPYALGRDQNVEQILEKTGSQLRISSDQMSVDKEIVSGSQNFYSVFSPFRNAVLLEFLASKEAQPVTQSQLLNPHIQIQPDTNSSILSLNIKTLQIDHTNPLQSEQKIFAAIDSPWLLHFGGDEVIDLDTFFPRQTFDEWYFTEADALQAFDRFNSEKILVYKEKRDDLGLDTIDGGQTSHMSLGLKWGLISARTLKNKIKEKHGDIQANPNLFHYISELIWREFYKYILYHHPDVLDLEFQKKFQRTINWEEKNIAKARFLSWVQGKTGYKLVDAAMNQMAQQGWMHNRSRMLVASILSKNLGVDWRWGQDAFRAMLLDLDEASNNGGWQWAASTGADPKPIRIFNPYLQEQNYDAKNLYKQKWLPEDYNLNDPIIDHKNARNEALKRYNLDKTTKPRDF